MMKLERLFERIAEINAWLDSENAGHLDACHDDAMRIMKIGEEYGEAVQAYIGMTGQNPRKGVTHTIPEMLEEVADVAVTALAAIQHFTGSPAETSAILLTKVDAIRARMDQIDVRGSQSDAG